MSKVSVKSISSVQITVSEEFASVLRSLVYALNWEQFPDAEEFVDALADIGTDEVNIDYNESTGEFVRA